MSARSTPVTLAAVATLGLSGRDAIDEMMDPANALGREIAELEAKIASNGG